jgi:hypothetical protein
VTLAVLADVIPEQNPYLSGLLSFPGPLRDCPAGTLSNYLEDRCDLAESADERALWRLMRVMVDSCGKARDDDEGHGGAGDADGSSTGAKVRRILNSGGGGGSSASSGNADIALQGSHTAPSDYEVEAAMFDIRNSLMSGNRKAAVERAASAGLWSHALLLASRVNREIYNDIVARFTAAHLPAGSPMHTLYHSFASRADKLLAKPDPASASGSSGSGSSGSGSSATGAGGNTGQGGAFYDDMHSGHDHFGGQHHDQHMQQHQQQQNLESQSAEAVLANWRGNLAIILANRTSETDGLVQKLGDALARRGSIFAAHFCYLVCHEQLAPLPGHGARMVLVGADHRPRGSPRRDAVTCMWFIRTFYHHFFFFFTPLAHTA